MLWSNRYIGGPSVVLINASNRLSRGGGNIYLHIKYIVYVLYVLVLYVIDFPNIKGVQHIAYM